MFEKICIAILGVVSVVFVALYYFCRVELQYLRSRLDKLITNYATVATAQQSIIDGLGTISNELAGVATEVSGISSGIGTVKDSIAAISDRISDAQRAVGTSADLIDEQQSILSRIQKEGQQGDS
jgi:methyl-accepting chemotaxis protein